MKFDVLFTRPRKVHFIFRRFTVLLSAAMLLTVMLSANSAFAEKLKLAVFPVNSTIDISATQKGYLYDAILEATSASAGSYIAIIPKQRVKGLLKKKKSACNVDCALNSAATIDARIALVVELNQDDGQIHGVVKLLDVQDEVLLTVKRFFSDSQKGAERELQSAVMFVLSAQFLPLSNADRLALQTEQQNIPATIAQPDPNQQNLHTSPSTPVQPTPPEKYTPQNSVSYSNTDISQPEEPGNPKAYLVTSVITGVLGVGLGIGAIVSGVQIGNEITKRDDQTFLKNQLNLDYNTVYENGDDPDLVENFNDRWGFLNLEYARDGVNREKIVAALDLYTKNIDLTNKAIKQNGIMAGVFGGLAVASLTVSTVFAIKYAKARKSGTQALRRPKLFFTPVVSRDMNGGVFSASF